MIQVIQDVQLATPLFVVPSADVSQNCKESMKELCMSQFEVSTKNFPNLVKTCEKYNVTVPNSIIVQPIFCNSASELFEYQNNLDAEKYHLFLKWYCTLIFIDYSVNQNIDESRNFFLKNKNIKSDRVAFVIFNASESLISYHNETTCVCFDTFSSTVAISCIQDFIARGISVEAINILEYGFNDFPMEPKSVRNAKVRADFAGISNNIPVFLSEVKTALKELESNDLFDVHASFFEILGLLELRNPGAVHSRKLTPSSIVSTSFNWMPSFSQKSMQFFISAANYYNKSANYGCCIDCGIRIIINGFKEAIQSVTHYIIHNSTEDCVISKTWDLLNVVNRFGMRRRTALLASQFSKEFSNTDESNSFTLFALKVILKDSSSSSLVQIRDLCIPMILIILEEKDRVPLKLYSKVLSKTMSAIGPALPLEQQKNLFSELEIYSCKKIKLPLSLIDIQPDKLKYTITKQEKKRRSGSGVFLYSYLPTTDNYVEITVDVNHSITISATFENPFSIVLRAEDVHLLVDKNGSANNIALCESSTEYFQSNSTNVIRCHITPQKVGECAIIGISMNFFGAIQKFLLKDPLILNVVGNVPNYHLRTDLPLSSSLSLYDGEIHDFIIWITNLGEMDISSVDINFLRPELAHLVQGPELPLAPNTQTTIRCAVTALKGEEYLAAKVVASCSKSEFCCSHHIRQKLIINDSLEIRRIYLMTTPPRGEYSFNKVFIGYEIRNLAPCSFMYKSNIYSNESTGLIGQNESLMMVGKYNPSDLITNGNDANKSKLIQKTKQKESEIGKSLTLSQRIKVAKCVSMLQKLMEQWKFEWTVSSIRKGELISKSAAVDEELFNGIESRQIKAKTTWLRYDNTQNEESSHKSKNESESNTEITSNPGKDDDLSACDEIKTESKYVLTVEFDKEMKKCSIEFFNENEDDEEEVNDILWEGELAQQDENGKNIYRFVLCFGQPKSYKFYISYTSKTGIEGQTQISVNVQE